jgi:hypothetical protein
MSFGVKKSRIYLMSVNKTKSKTLSCRVCFWTNLTIFRVDEVLVLFPLNFKVKKIKKKHGIRQNHSVSVF